MKKHILVAVLALLLLLPCFAACKKEPEEPLYPAHEFYTADGLVQSKQVHFFVTDERITPATTELHVTLQNTGSELVSGPGETSIEIEQYGAEGWQAAPPREGGWSVLDIASLTYLKPGMQDEMVMQVYSVNKKSSYYSFQYAPLTPGAYRLVLRDYRIGEQTASAVAYFTVTAE